LLSLFTTIWVNDFQMMSIERNSKKRTDIEFWQAHLTMQHSITPNLDILVCMQLTTCVWCVVESIPRCVQTHLSLNESVIESLCSLQYGLAYESVARGNSSEGCPKDQVASF
jgi:hypothetical protein